MEKAIITVVGKDVVGVIANVCGYLAKHNVNILDISQTIVHGYFNMMMVVDTSGLDMDFSVFSQEVQKLEEQRGFEIRCIKSEIFDKMHRV